MIDWNYYIDRARALGQLRRSLAVAFVRRSVCGFSVAGAYGLHGPGHGFGVRDYFDFRGDLGAVFGQHDCFLAPKALGQV